LNEVIELGLGQMIVAYVFVVLLLIIVRIKGIKREKEILIGSIRMTLQLILTGYILSLLFENPHPLLTLLVLIIMEVFAIFNVYKRVKYKMNHKLKKAIALSMSIGTVSTLFIFILGVIRLNPWFDPRYFITLMGMLIGNAMTGISLGVNHLISGMEKQKALVEGALILGATPKEATKEIVNEAFDAAFLPTINSMVGMGIVFLPGMMTGQILSGISPITAIEYQIAIMLGILGSVALSVFLFVSWGYKTFFNEEDQLLLDEEM
jgi:putative ABC transport system permease protein